MRATVVVNREGSQKIHLPPGKVVQIGRDPDLSQILLTSGNVSRQHCTLLFDGNGVTLTDLRSRNGTFVNKAQVTVHRFDDNGAFSVCGIEFLIELVAENATPVESPTAAG